MTVNEEGLYTQTLCFYDHLCHFLVFCFYNTGHSVMQVLHILYEFSINHIFRHLAFLTCCSATSMLSVQLFGHITGSLHREK